MQSGKTPSFSKKGRKSQEKNIRHDVHEPCLGAYLFLIHFGCGRIGGEGLFEGVLNYLASGSKLLFSTVLNKQSKFKHQSLSKF